MISKYSPLIYVGGVCYTGIRCKEKIKSLKSTLEKEKGRINEVNFEEDEKKRHYTRMYVGCLLNLVKGYVPITADTSFFNDFSSKHWRLWMA